jgi:hypothetical protein
MRSSGKTGEGSFSANLQEVASRMDTPHPALRATFSRKGRREERPRTLQGIAPFAAATQKFSGARYTKARSRKRGGAAFVLIEALLVHSYSSALHAPHR